MPGPQRNPSRTRWLPGLAPLLALLGACGGGGGTGSAPTASSAASAPGIASGSTCGLADFRTAALTRINQYRASGANCGTAGTFGAATALVWNNALTQAAEGHSQDMAANNFFSHTGSAGSTLAQRVDATGYGWSALAENIAAGQVTINQAVDGWMASDGHCANMMNPNLADIGLVCVSGSSSDTYPTYWTMDLGRPR
jgi:uncharacterized protein YkwD